MFICRQFMGFEKAPLLNPFKNNAVALVLYYTVCPLTNEEWWAQTHELKVTQHKIEYRTENNVCFARKIRCEVLSDTQRGWELQLVDSRHVPTVEETWHVTVRHNTAALSILYSNTRLLRSAMNVIAICIGYFCDSHILSMCSIVAL